MSKNMLSAVIPVFNKVELTRFCLSSLQAHSRCLSEVIVVNNASKDQTSDTLLEFSESFTRLGISFQIIENEVNLGFGRACNQGIRAAKGTYVSIINNDTWLSPGWDENLIAVLKERALDVVGPHYDERPLPHGSSSELNQILLERATQFILKNGDSFRRHFVPILMLFKRSAIEQLAFPHHGIFDERFFVTYEDTDLKYRMEKDKISFGQTAKCYIWHQSMGTRGAPGLLPNGYEAEGLRLFMEKWGFDPRDAEKKLLARLLRKYRKWRSMRGRF